MISATLKGLNEEIIIEVIELPVLNVRDRIDLDGYGLIEIISKTYRPATEQFTYVVVFLEHY